MKRFKSIAERIRFLVSEWEIKLGSVEEQNIMIPRNHQKRTVKQIVGHMIDSVSNNTHRVVHLQYQESPFEFPNYATNGNNEKWIEIQNYQNANWDEMVQLWKYSHLHFAYVIQHIDPDKLDTEWIAEEGLKITLQEMIEDFPRHMQLHLDEIAELLSY